MSVNISIKKKKTKTFTGCATCRSRKIKCDLGRPSCQRCIKSGLICAGYQIVLCWSRPVQFDKYGYQKRGSAIFPNESDEETQLQQQQQRGFQRRNVEFVKYDKEYETYEDMDRDLGLLHTPEYSLIEKNKTWLQGPFGVFEGLIEVPSNLLKKRRRLAKSKYAIQSREDTLTSTNDDDTNSPNSNNNNNNNDDNTDDQLLRHKYPTENSSTNNLKINQGIQTGSTNTPTTSNDGSSSTNKNILNWSNDENQPSIFDAAHKFNQEWLSNELRYDALLSASAAATSLSNENNNMFFDFLYPLNSNGNNNNHNSTNSNKNINTNTLNNGNLLSINNSNSIEENKQYNDREVFNALRPQHNYNLDILNDLNNFTTSLNNNNFTTHNSTNTSTTQSNNQNGLQQLTEGQKKFKTTEYNDDDDDIVLETNESHMPESIIKRISTPLTLTTNSIKIPTTGLQINSLTRYLLEYYVQEVANMLTVVGFKHNPWKTIYFPKAKMALGDLSTFGKTSNSRMSILNALLAVSCFRLQSKYSKGSKEMVFFVNLGFEFRLQASSFLKKIFDEKINGQLNMNKIIQNEKYKDILVALLSMISVDFVWGTLAGCQYHLSLVEIIISKRMKDRPQLSNKAKILHRLYSQVKILQDSTNYENLNKLSDIVKVENLMKQFELTFNSKNFENNTDKSFRTHGEFIETVDNVTGVFNIQFKRTDTKIVVKSPEFVDDLNFKTKDNKYVIDSAATFGLPNSLILLFNETVDLIKLRYFIRKQPKDSKLRDRYIEIITYFQIELINWKSEWKCLKDDKPDSGFISDLHEALYHHSISFHDSLIVYFLTMIRDAENRHLQDYVKSNIDHLERLQELVDENKVDMAPLIWQGFISGFSAMGDLQERFKEWAKLFAKSGISTYWGARQIMFEIWRRRTNSELNDNWVSVHKDWEMNLMLT